MRFRPARGGLSSTLERSNYNERLKGDCKGTKMRNKTGIKGFTGSSQNKNKNKKFSQLSQLVPKQGQAEQRAGSISLSRCVASLAIGFKEMNHGCQIFQICIHTLMTESCSNKVLRMKYNPCSTLFILDVSKYLSKK